MENQYNLRLNIIKNKLEKFNLNLEFEHIMENGTSLISIKDNNQNLLSQLIIPDSVHTTEEITFEKEGKNPELDLVSDFLQIIIIDLEKYKYNILEDNKDVKIEDSKFKDIYKMFDKQAYIPEFGEYFVLSEIPQIDYIDCSYPISKTLLHDECQINQSLLDHLQTPNNNTQLRKKIKIK